MMTTSMTTGEKIQKLRKERDISQDSLASQLNVTRQAISKWETGESMPDIDNIVQLSNIFQVSVDYLLKNQEPEVEPEPLVGEVVDRFMGFDVEERVSHFSFSMTGSSFSIALVTYLVLGFGFGLWHPGWLVFIAFDVLNKLIKSYRKGRIKLPITSLGVLVYLFIGSVFDMWHPWWIIVVIACFAPKMVIRVNRR